MHEASDGICFWPIHLPAVTGGDVIRREDGLGLHLHGTVLLGDVVLQAQGVMSRETLNRPWKNGG